ncbi:MAG: MotA/TolQ/ExbB proton channel family protein [Planctomycetota bacterium]|nr:MotA/TolQ/ExbB proton channel family protein [Planctomycetota bacterium]
MDPLSAFRGFRIMYFSIACPHCQKNLKVRDELVGSTARCPHCRGTITVQRPATAAAEDATTPAAGTTAPPIVQTGSIPQKSEPSTPPVSQVLSVTANTNVNVGVFILFGLAATVIFYLVLWPFAGTPAQRSYLGRLFMGGENATMANGLWVPYAEVFLFFWAVGMLISKYFKIRRQRRALLFDVLPSDIGEKITTKNLDAFLKYIGDLPRDAVGSFLVTRCVRGLEHFRSRRSAADTATMLASQSDLDAGSVDSSYSLFHVFIWAIPILGFLGTVIGVSSAVGGFTDTLSQSSDMESLKAGLKNITGGLGTSFDTTLVALSMAMILTFPVTALQKMEGDVIGEVDEYTNEYLLRRLEDGRGGPEQQAAGPAANRIDIQVGVNAALTAHRAELESWGNQLKSLGSTVAADLLDSWKKIDDRETERMAQTEAMLGRFVGRLDGVGEQIGKKVQDGWLQVTDAMHAKHADQAAQLNAVLTHSRDELTAIAVDAEAARERASQTMAQAADQVKSFSTTLQQGLSGLSETLQKLDGKTVTVEMKPRSWFGFGGKSKAGRNGSAKYRS